MTGVDRMRKMFRLPAVGLSLSPKKIFVLVLLLSVIGESGGCVSDMENLPEFKSCDDAYMTYLANAGSSVPSGAGNQMVQIICTDEGKSALGCLYPFYQRCPSIAATPQRSILHQIKAFGGVEELCDKVAVTPTCTPVDRCLNENFPTDPSLVSRINTLKDTLHEIINRVCGSIKEQFECFDGKEGECPDQVKKLQTRLANQIPEGCNLSDYSTAKNFIFTLCKKVPNDLKQMKNLTLSEVCSTYKNSDDTCGCISTRLKQYEDLYQTAGHQSNPSNGSTCFLSSFHITAVFFVAMYVGLFLLA